MLMHLQRPIGVAQKYSTTNNNGILAGTYKIHASGGGGGGGGGANFAGPTESGKPGGRATYSSATTLAISQVSLKSSGQKPSPVGGTGGAFGTGDDGTTGGSALLFNPSSVALVNVSAGALGVGANTSPVAAAARFALASIFPYETSNEIGKGGDGGIGSFTSGEQGYPGKVGAIWCEKLA